MRERKKTSVFWFAAIAAIVVLVAMMIAGLAYINFVGRENKKTFEKIHQEQLHRMSELSKNNDVKEFEFRKMNK